jgi:hypothetical protein
MKTKLFYFTIIAGILLSACATRRAKIIVSYDPTFQTTVIKSVAIFSMRNSALNPSESVEFDNKVKEVFSQKNNSITLIDIAQSKELINKEKLQPELANFLQNFESSGIPDLVFLKKLKSLFNIDAILQGSVTDIKSSDKLSGMKAYTSLTFRYSLLNTSNGKILWQSSSHAVVEYGKTKGMVAPPFYEVAQLAFKKIINTVPTVVK